MRIVKKIGVISLILALLAIFPSLTSGVGVVLAFFALVLSGISAITGDLKYVGLVVLITTINLFVLSAVSTSWMNKQYESPYPYGEPPPDWPELKGADEKKKKRYIISLKSLAFHMGQHSCAYPLVYGVESIMLHKIHITGRLNSNVMCKRKSNGRKIPRYNKITSFV